ncbi:uncharacterized protein LOC106977867 isoform X8 [Acinonyx jubatus]|uniref:Uncharacterized protein LOC106977867 isoform X8 n=1 Tax=Acinonyx jubatus TaxID=32536 RepID=A0ABM3NI42_ACIJB|nr:uncharacterized protein LOC106977867 isoform X8 [Acinonyx jubatus]
MPTRRLWIREETRLLGFLFSGVFAVLTERMRSTFLMSYTMAVNIRAQWPIGYTKLNISDNKDVVHGRRGSFSYILKNCNDLSQGGKCSGE